MIVKVIKDCGINVNVVVIEKEYLNVECYEELMKLFLNVVFKLVEEKVCEFCLIKDEKEFFILCEVVKMVDYVVEVGVNVIKEDCSELEVLVIIEYELKIKGIYKMLFDMMVLVGVNLVFLYGIFGVNKMKCGDFVLFDLGVIIDGYCFDIICIVVFGEIFEE